MTYGVWSIAFGFLFQALGLIEYSITGLAIVGVVVIVIGTILVIANPKELIQLRGGNEDVTI